MQTVTIQEAQAHLPVLIAKMKPGDELMIADHDRPVARLIAEPSPMPKARQPGSAIGKLTIVEDDEGHLEDFREYMP